MLPDELQNVVQEEEVLPRARKPVCGQATFPRQPLDRLRRHLEQVAHLRRGHDRPVAIGAARPVAPVGHIVSITMKHNAQTLMTPFRDGRAPSNELRNAKGTLP